MLTSGWNKEHAVMILEDEEGMVSFLRFALDRSNIPICRVEKDAENAFKWLQKIHRSPSHQKEFPKIILADIILSGKMTGIEFAEKVSQLYDIPVIFMTGEESYFEQAVELNPYGFLVKPFGVTELLNLLRISVNLHEKKRELSEANETLLKQMQTLKKYEMQLRELNLKIFQNEEELQKKISMELHDNICQTLAAIALKMRSVFMENSPIMCHMHEHIAKTIDSVIAEIKTITNDLTPKGLEELGIEAALKNLMISTLNGTNIRCHIESRLTKNLSSVAKEAQLQLYRSVQEALSNSIKHSGATVISLSLSNTSKNLLVKIKDNGCGFYPDKIHNKRGLGLLNIEERMKSVSGTVKITSIPGKGTSLNLRIPFL